MTQELVINDTETIKVVEPDYSKAISYYESLSDYKKKELEEIVYREYIKECGQETKFQQIAFKAGKNTLIYKYILKTLDSEPEEKKDILTDIDAFNSYINENIALYKTVLELSEVRIKEIKREILKELSPKFVKKIITLDEIDKVLAEKIK